MQVELVAYRPEYLDAFLAWRAQARHRRHNPLTPLTRTEAAERLAAEGSDLARLSRFGAFRWFVLVDGALAGNVSLTNINAMMRTAEIAYGLDEAHHGRGLGTAAVRLLVERVFAETDLRKLVAYVHDENVPSLRLLERLGFQREGLLREHYLIEGAPVNEVVLGLLRTEWDPGAISSD